jgi:hypothetical protein
VSQNLPVWEPPSQRAVHPPDPRVKLAHLRGLDEFAPKTSWRSARCRTWPRPSRARSRRHQVDEHATASGTDQHRDPVGDPRFDSRDLIHEHPARPTTSDARCETVVTRLNPAASSTRRSHIVRNEVPYVNLGSSRSALVLRHRSNVAFAGRSPAEEVCVGLGRASAGDEVVNPAPGRMQAVRSELLRGVAGLG